MKILLAQLDRRIGELSLLYMDMVVCEALKYPMLIQLDSCRYRLMTIIMILMIMIVVRMPMIMIVPVALKYSMPIQFNSYRQA